MSLPDLRRLVPSVPGFTALLPAPELRMCLRLCVVGADLYMYGKALQVLDNC